jgi:hypothetical protein
MNVQADPSVGGAQRLLPFERTALVLQGGGAPGAYQAGTARTKWRRHSSRSYGLMASS